ncbi:uncharacterized protein LOC117107578 [Anneissia japonica]|uniref:uncharacterized protein LOC117107578 n=1 Tax=Anneissia japonica TaxID=1529436 RepID=UPI00142592ED|nr:uncharacterized protein LOC117107578 [Anneissia japonica]
MFLKHWIDIHGAPKRMMSDNGGEFDNLLVKDMGENFNIEIVTTASYSPYSNGICEKHNGVLTEILMKLKKNHNYDLETSLLWVINAKKCLHNVYGFSPFQIAMGRNPDLPSVLNDKLQALEGQSVCVQVAKHINVMYNARKEFLNTESSEKYRRALRKQTRSFEDKYEQGDKVYYKRPNGMEWKGPVTVIGKDSSIVFIRHGGSVIKVHKCRIQKGNQNKVVDETNNNFDSNVQLKSKENEPPNIVHDNSSDSIGH